MKGPVRIGLVGLGTVGRGVVQVLQRNRALIEAKVGAPVELAMVCDRSLSARDARAMGLESVFVRRAEEILINPDIDIFVELIGGYEPARTFVLKALHAGKHVVTANKAILAKYWGDIFEHARVYRRLVYFEGAVGGGIPVIQALNEGLAGNRIKRIIGILNGTTNFMLTRMSQAGLDYKAALREAQQAGFAEADPSFDVEGRDAAHKIAILGSIASGARVRLEDVAVEGITELDSRDIAFVREEFGYVVKLLGVAHFEKAGVSVRVYPALLPEAHPFATVQNEYNAIVLEGDAVGDVMLYGRGAGSLAAASAVVSDITYVARQIAAGTAGKLPYVSGDHRRPAPAIRPEDMVSRFYLRFSVSDRPGVLASIAGVLGRYGISISGVYQPEARRFDNKAGASIMIFTHATREGLVQKALRDIRRQSVLRGPTVLLRVAA